MCPIRIPKLEFFLMEHVFQHQPPSEQMSLEENVFRAKVSAPKEFVLLLSLALALCLSIAKMAI